MIDEFVAVENEEEAPIIEIECRSALLRFYLYIKDNNEIIRISDLHHVPYGSICVDRRVIYEKPTRSGVYVYHPQLKDQENWGYWGWLLSLKNFKDPAIEELKEFLRNGGFTLFSIYKRV